MKRDNPYVGPRTFEEGDSELFFGREQEASNLLSLVVSQRLVLFYAQSGAGKSSLINTRLISGLRQENFRVLPVARVGGAIPEGIRDIKNVFVFNLIFSLEARQAAQELAGLSLLEYLQRRREREGQQEAPHVLIVDQFEEIVTTNLSRWEEREDFFTQLRQVIKDDPYLWVVLTIREDYLAALDPYAPILPNKLRVRFHMQRMKAEAALEAIETPAQLGERPFAPDVAQILVDNLRQLRSQDTRKARLGEYIEPVQLQVVCYQLWENLKDQAKTLITAEDLYELGDVDVALAQFYEDALAAVVGTANISEINLRNWFENELITETQTRGAVYQGLTETVGLANQTVRLLANRYLLRAEIRSGGVWYELVHDRFIGPILQSNQRWRFKQSALIQAALAWQDAGKDPAYLHTGQHLAEILEDVDRESQELIVKEFIWASEKEDRAVKARANMRQHLSEARNQVEEHEQKIQQLNFWVKILASISLLLLFVACMFEPLLIFSLMTEGMSEQRRQVRLTDTFVYRTRIQTTQDAPTETITTDDFQYTLLLTRFIDLNIAFEQAEATIQALSTAVTLERCNTGGWMDLPFPYEGIKPVFGGTAEQFRVISQRSRDSGRISAFFDHQYPIFTPAFGGYEPEDVTTTLLLFDGSLSFDALSQAEETVGSDARFDYYSGQGGYAFAPASVGDPRIPQTPVLAAADGFLYRAEIDTDGNHMIWIRHDRGEDGVYATLYFHLADDEFFQAMMAMEEGTAIVAGTRIGTMGTTGRSTGIHLHFQVRLDIDRDDEFAPFERVDPYGYFPSADFPIDPWSLPTTFELDDGEIYEHPGIVSQYLWIHPIFDCDQIPPTTTPTKATSTPTVPLTVTGTLTLASSTSTGTPTTVVPTTTPSPSPTSSE